MLAPEVLKEEPSEDAPDGITCQQNTQHREGAFDGLTNAVVHPCRYSLHGGGRPRWGQLVGVRHYCGVSEGVGGSLHAEFNRDDPPRRRRQRNQSQSEGVVDEAHAEAVDVTDSLQDFPRYGEKNHFAA